MTQDPKSKITEHFFFEDAYCKCGKCGPMSDSIINNVVELAERLEKVIKTANVLIKEYNLDIPDIILKITSWYRCWDKNSAHSLGLAADIDCQNSLIREILVESAVLSKINRIGVYLNRKIVHLDIDQTAPDIRPSHQLWVQV